MTLRYLASGITRSSKKRAISAIQSLSAPGAPEAVSSVVHERHAQVQFIRLTFTARFGRYCPTTAIWTASRMG